MKVIAAQKVSVLPFWITWFCLPLLIVLVGVMLIYALKDSSRFIEAHLAWKEASAQVVSLQRAGKGYSVEYRYLVEEKSYLGKDIFPLPKKFIGEEIVIRYNPKNPTESQAVFFWTTFLFALIFTIGEICFFIAWIQQIYLRKEIFLLKKKGAYHREDGR